MKFLIGIGSTEYSKETITFGGRIAVAFGADLSVLYVTAPPSATTQTEVSLSRAKLSEWDIEPPGIQVLRFAREVLRDTDMLKVTPAGEVVERHALKPDINGAHELHVFGAHGENVRLRLREGEIVEEVKKEVEVGGYDLAILGASKKRRLVHKMVQFVDCSLLILRNVRDIDYRFLFCTDGSEMAQRSLRLGSRAAAFYKAKGTVLSMASSEEGRSEAESIAQRAARVLGAAGVSVDTRVEVGEMVEAIVAAAGDDHIIVMGASKQSEITKFIRGSTPIKVVQQGHSPVLIAK